MESSLSNPADNLMKGIHTIKCKDCNCLLEYETVNDSLINWKCLSCNKHFLKKIVKNLKDRYENTFKFSNDFNKFILLLRKGVYHYEFMDGWEKFHEKSLPEEGEFCSNLNMDDITDSNQNQAKRICKDF